ncbi:MAG: methyltransferase [Sandaracinaceae bacterium]
MTWEQAWTEGRTPWDAGEPAPALTDLLAAPERPRGRRVLVPGCGSGYDVFAFGEAGYEAVGLEVAPSAAERFRAARRERGLDEARARIVVEDFFGFEPDRPFDVIWDYTFLCALDPDLRPAWAEKIDRLLAPGGELVTLIFPVVERSPGGESGPPYALRPEHLLRLLQPRYRAEHLAPVARSHPGREGMEWLGRWRRRSGG